MLVDFRKSFVMGIKVLPDYSHHLVIFFRVYIQNGGIFHDCIGNIRVQDDAVIVFKVMRLVGIEMGELNPRIWTTKKSVRILRL